MSVVLCCPFLFGFAFIHVVYPIYEAILFLVSCSCLLHSAGFSHIELMVSRGWTHTPATCRLVIILHEIDTRAMA
ncbi:hypothetical protein F5Y01DRAFT_229740 [Xylaria sp. FL0043]|nr:hypothetical protein F5Y01DRAFT_229740 [Xylaria sp. FL0043]